MVSVQLLIRNERAPALDELRFSHPLLVKPQISRRGRGFASAIFEHTFQWTAAVQALTVLFLLTKAESLASTRGDQACQGVFLIGDTGSLAASLDYALSKKPLWMLDMFGMDSAGVSLTRRLFVRWNPERKRGGEVMVALNAGQGSPLVITVSLDNAVIDCPTRCRQLANAIELEFVRYRSLKTSPPKEHLREMQQ